MTVLHDLHSNINTNLLESWNRAVDTVIFDNYHHKYDYYISIFNRNNNNTKIRMNIYSDHDRNDDEN